MSSSRGQLRTHIDFGGIVSNCNCNFMYWVCSIYQLPRTRDARSSWSNAFCRVLCGGSVESWYIAPSWSTTNSINIGIKKRSDTLLKWLSGRMLTQPIFGRVLKVLFFLKMFRMTPFERESHIELRKSARQHGWIEENSWWLDLRTPWLSSLSKEQLWLNTYSSTWCIYTNI